MGNCLKSMLFSEETGSQKIHSNGDIGDKSVAGVRRNPSLQEASLQNCSASKKSSSIQHLPAITRKKQHVVRKLFDSENESLPATITVDDTESFKGSVVLVNINQANIYELQVLGFSKEEADAVVACRVRNGPFRTRDEAGRVPGISATTWLKVEGKIFPMSSESHRHTLPVKPSRLKKEVAVADEKVTGRYDKKPQDAVVAVAGEEYKSKVDINRSNMHELCAVKLSREQATDLIDHRIRNGYFSSVHGVKAIPSITEETYSRVSHRLTIIPGDGMNQTPNRKQCKSNRRSQSLLPSTYQRIYHSPGCNALPVVGVGNEERHKRASKDSNTPSIPLAASVHVSPNSRYTLSPANLCTPLQVQKGAASATSFHETPPRSSGRRSKATNIRIATWNLQCFNDKRVENPGVLEVVCTTIIRHGFDVLVVQELGSKESLDKVCEQLNNPSLSQVVSMGGNKRQWKCMTYEKYTGRMFMGMEYNGFLWNECSGVTLLKIHLLEYQSFVRKPLLGTFQVNRWVFSLVSIHLKSEGGWGKDDHERLYKEVIELHHLVKDQSTEPDIILLGDFNCQPTLPYFEPLRREGYTNIFDSEPTNISAANPDGNKCYDNIWISEGLRERCGGEIPHRVVRRNLEHRDITDRKSPGKPGTVSDHCPIWASFSIH